ncbi:MAG TPA: PfkB family carbohydrate kinase [Flavisolibacter sp.]|nr:PfkB family carbohydrate kinase [Flavisolibacter sp.]
MIYDICCIGHITLDRIVTPKTTVYMPGGTSFYFSHALSCFDISYALVTALAQSEMQSVNDLRAKGIVVKALPSAHTVYFENSYSENQDHRTQRVLQVADAFGVAQLQDTDARIFHLGPLLAGDMSLDLIKTLASRSKLSLDVQGFLRKVENSSVHPIDWAGKEQALPHIHFLKANEYEMEVLTGHADVYKGAKTLSGWGVKEVIITLGSKGSVILHEGVYYSIPAYYPVSVEDATGCGDTYMAGYLYQRIKGTPIQQAGEFAAAMATLKIESSGPFTGTKEEVYALLEDNARMVANA